MDSAWVSLASRASHRDSSSVTLATIRFCVFGDGGEELVNDERATHQGEHDFDRFPDVEIHGRELRWGRRQ